jgi:hypothetical protein
MHYFNIFFQQIILNLIQASGVDLMLKYYASMLLFIIHMEIRVLHFYS